MIPGNLEAACVRPGLWRIEGYDVRRVGRRWTVYRNGRRVGATPTLEDACYLIDEDQRPQPAITEEF